MRRGVARTTVALMVMMLIEGTTVDAAEFVNVGLGETSFRAVAVSPTQSDRIVVASERVLYESTNDGRTWTERFRLPTGVRASRLAIEPTAEPVILLATSRGLYGSFDGGSHWSLIFRGVGEAEADCTFVTFHPSQPGVALLGTRNGLFLSQDRGRHWTAATTPPGVREIVQVAFDPEDADQLYLLAPDALFVGNVTDGTWQRRFGTVERPTEEQAVEERPEAQETAEADALLHHLSAVAVDPSRPSTIYLATSHGLQLSEDRGLAWKPMSRSGLPEAMLTRLLIQRRSPSIVYAATSQGVSRYRPTRDEWTALATGLDATTVNDMAASPTSLWAATDRGLARYAVPLETFSEMESIGPHELLDSFRYEPTITQVQQAAIRYAEVQPEKIERWRRQAALKALFPNVGVGLDHGASRNVHVDEGSFPNFQVIETRDRDAGLDLSVTWNLGELIWNDDQTSIDVRSKLMVELRDDIVDEVTRTYFERRRLQVALLTKPPSDPQALLDKELRVQELTALLDGLTGGYFSQHLATTPRE